MSPVLRPPVRALSALQDPVAEIYPSLVYNPSMRGSQRRRTYSPTAVRSNPDTEEANADELRMDAFERAYAIKWISVLVATLGEEQEADQGSVVAAYMRLVQTTAALFATCTGPRP